MEGKMHNEKWEYCAHILESCSVAWYPGPITEAVKDGRARRIQELYNPNSEPMGKQPNSETYPKITTQ